MSKLTKERVEELRESINLSCDAFIPLDEGESADLLAILDDYADWLPAIKAAEKADRSLLADIPDERGDT